MGDFKLSPAYDLLNSHIHIEDKDFALEDGLLPRNLAQGKIGSQFTKVAEHAEINEKIYKDLLSLMVGQSHFVQKMITSSFLDEETKRNYWQSYQGRLKQLKKV